MTNVADLTTRGIVSTQIVGSSLVLRADSSYVSEAQWSGDLEEVLRAALRIPAGVELGGGTLDEAGETIDLLVSRETIEALRIEAGQAGDAETVEICRQAEDGDDAARAEVIAVLLDAAASDDAATLHDYATGEALRPATAEELAASVAAAETDGGSGVIEVDGRRCYVQE